MKMGYGALVAAIVMVFSVAAEAAEYQHFNVQDKRWRRTFSEWVQKFRPSPENITSGISGEDIHVYLVPGQFTGTYSLLRGKHAPDRANAIIRALLDGGTGKIVGFAGEYVFILTWTKPPPS